MHPQKDTFTLLVVVLTTRPPGGLIPNQVRAASPMVCGRRLCTWLGWRRATGDGRGQSHRPPWCARNESESWRNDEFSDPQSIVEVWYISTYVKNKKNRRVRTPIKLVPKEILVGTFRYHFLAGTPFSLKKGALAPVLRKKGSQAPFLIQPAPLLQKKGVPAKYLIPTGNTDRQVNLIPAKYRYQKNCW